MKTWFQRLIALLQPARPGLAARAGRPDVASGGGRAGASSGATGATGAPVAAAIKPVPPFAQAFEFNFLAWLIDSPTQTHVDAPPDSRESKTLLGLAQLIADRGAHSTLLPRATAVVPQLLAGLRSESSSNSALAQLVSRDLTLVAEVIRMANSTYYRREAVVVDIEQAIRVLGSVGLRSAIARTLLKPLFDRRSGEMVARSAARLWQHTDHKAQLCAVLARSEGADAFEAYLLGLVHNAVWSLILRVMDCLDGPSPWRLSPSFAASLSRQRDRLFGIVAEQWPMTQSLTQVAALVARHGLAASRSARARRLSIGDHLATLLCDPDPERAARIAEPLLAQLAPPVRACYLALRHTSLPAH